MDDTLEVTTETGKHTLNTDKIRLGLSVSTLATLKPNVFQSLVAGDYIQVEGSSAKKQRGVQKVLTKTAVAIGLVTELFDTGAGTAPTNDFSVVAAGDPIVVKVFRRGYNTNLHQN